MDNFVLTCCSTVDLDEAFFEKRHIPFVCFHFRMDGVDYPDGIRSEPYKIRTLYYRDRI